MLGNWLKRRRIAKHSHEFWNLLTRGETQAALSLYRRELGPAGVEVSRETRVVFHLHRWLAERSEADLQSARALAGECPPKSAVGHAWRVLQQLHGQAGLAKALAERGGATAADWSPVGAAISEDVPMESLGRAVLEVQSMPASAPGKEREQRARNVLSLLAVAPSLSTVKPIYGHLLAWACQILNDHGRILADRSAIDTIGGSKAQLAILAAARELARFELAKGNINGATAALSQAKSLANEAVMQAILLDCGVCALNHAPEAAAKWFTHYLQEAKARPWQATLRLGAAMGFIRNAQYAEAREALAKVLVDFSGDLSSLGPETGFCLRLRQQAAYLAALSRLATTKDWGVPTGGGSPAEAVARRQGLVKNRSLWSDLRQYIDPSVRDLVDGDPEVAWRGNLLAGLVAYVDSSYPLDLAGVERFSNAIGCVASVPARTWLRMFEATLVARARATEQAMDLIQRNKHGHLQELKETILSEMGDAIPPLVRAAVYMTLWSANQKYNPLPDLRSIPLQTSDEALVGECIAQVQVGSSLAQLRKMCMGQAGSEEVVPSMEPLALFDSIVFQRASLAAALIHLRRGDLAVARTLLDRTGEQANPAELAYTRFYLAWKESDALACRALADGKSGQRIRQLPGWSGALTVMTLLNTLASEQGPMVWDQLIEITGGPDVKRLKDTVSRLATWLLKEHRPALARTLLRIVDSRESVDTGSPSQEAQSLAWMCLLLSGFVAAQMGQYTVCIDIIDRFLSLPRPALPAFGSSQEDSRAVAWARLLRVDAELGLTAGTSEDPKARWRSVQRTLEDHIPHLVENPTTRPYAFLLTGLCTHLSADTLVDEEIILHLGEAQQALAMQKHAPYLQEVLGRLVWRKRVLEAFWRSISAQDLKNARLIYQEELLPAFGVRMPHSIQLGMVIVDWDANAAATDALLERLETLRHEAPELNGELVDTARDYILESDRIRHLIRLLKDQQFGELVEQIDHLTWLGLDPGAMPLPVAIARLYACFKLRRTDEATAMGAQISQANNYAQWVIDDGALLLGYVLFDQQKYPDAAGAFEKIGSSSLLGHDTDKYWAASQFNHGLQLLKVDQKEKAFEAFAKSLGKAAGSQAAGNLTPLFVHFALQAFDIRNGDQARQSFVLMGRSLAGGEESAEKRVGEVTAQMGQLLCQALMEEDVRDLSGENFIHLWDPLAHEEAAKSIEAQVRINLERSLRIMGICQELRRQRRLPANERQSSSRLTTFLRQQIARLEPLQEQLKQQDPMLLVLKGLVDLLLDKGKTSDALNALEQAIRLGIQSPRLAALLDRQRELVQKAMARNREALDLFDLYLSSGTIPPDLRNRLLRDDDLAHLYRVGRNYLPADIVADEIKPGTALLCERLERLQKLITSDSLKEDGEFATLAETIGGLMEALRKTERQLLDAEKKAMQRLAALLRAQSVEPARSR